MLREADQQNPRAAALMGNLEEIPAKRKIVSLLYKSIGKNARKMLMNKFPTINILLIELRESMQNCSECFQIRRNRTLDRHVFLSRKQKPSESLNQFWNALNGLAANCNFGDQTESLVHDIFVLNMANKQVQEKLCMEPKETPAEALHFAIAFEDGLKRQKFYDHTNQKPRVEDEPLCAVSTSNSRECWRCGAGYFTLDLLKRCKAPEAMCNYCGRKGHLERVCNQKKKDTYQKSGNFRESGRRVQLVDQEDFDEDYEEDYMVLNVQGGNNDAKPLYMDGFINGNRFKTTIDTGSPVTIFALDEIKRIMKREKLQV